MTTSTDYVDRALKELRREEANKRCFECSERGPQYVDCDHKTFVCTTCAGILREFSTRIKGLSMATFTAAEVDGLRESGGNEGARKKWLIAFNESRDGDKMPSPGEKEKIRAFIRYKYERKRWTAARAKKREEEAEEEAPAKPPKKSQQPPRRDAESEDDDEAIFSKPSKTKPAPKKAREPNPEPADLLDFADFRAAPPLAESPNNPKGEDSFFSSPKFNAASPLAWRSNGGSAQQHEQRTHDPFQSAASPVFGTPVVERAAAPSFGGGFGTIPPAAKQTSSGGAALSFAPGAPAPTAQQLAEFLTANPDAMKQFVAFLTAQRHPSTLPPAGAPSGFSPVQAQTAPVFPGFGGATQSPQFLQPSPPAATPAPSAPTDFFAFPTYVAPAKAPVAPLASGPPPPVAAASSTADILDLWG